MVCRTAVSKARRFFRRGVATTFLCVFFQCLPIFLHRGRLADTKAALVTGESQLKSSEGVMRLMAAAVMSMARAQRCAA